MEKLKVIFTDGEITKFNFENGHIIIRQKQIKPKKWVAVIGWNFGKLINSPFDMLDEWRTTDTKNKILIKEIKKLHDLLKKQKQKSKDMKDLINALLIVNHEIKSEILIEQNLF